MNRFLLLTGALASIFAAGMPAQVSLTGAVNAASYLNATLPNGKLAPGGLFVGFGKGMGPAKLASITKFPLETSLGGTSVSATVGSTTVECLMIYTSAGQLAAVLPSNTPVGAGTMAVTYNNQTSAPLNITVIAHDFGIFALNQGGSGPGIYTNALTYALNGIGASANPTDLVDIWGTGLGAVAGNEAGGPLPGDMPNLDVQVFVGSESAQVLYRGRSGCCTALDQIRISIPKGISGCYVPLYIVVAGVVSNFTTISIADSGSSCPDPGYSSDLLDIARKNGGLRVGSAALSRLQGYTQTTSNIGDSASVSFVKVPLSSLQYSGPLPKANTCYVVQFPGGAGGGASYLRAGSVTMSGPIGTYPLPQAQTGVYELTFSPSSPTYPGIINDGTLLTPGDYTFTGTAGTDIGAFTVKVPLPAALDWTNIPARPVKIPRAHSLTINWTNGYSGALVQMIGQSQATLGVGAQFTCWADATAGTFTIPEAILSAIPATYFSSKVPQGSLSVIQVFTSSDFSAPGIDYGGIQFADGFDMGAVTYQ